MSVLQALILGLIQGLTEFLPISSSGHLEIGKVLLNVELKDNLIFLVVVHGATVLSTIVVFWKEIKKLFSDLFKFQWNDSTEYIAKLLLSMIPVLIIGLLFKDELEELFTGNLLLVGVMLCTTAILLALAYKVKQGNKKISFLNSFIVGIAQAIAVLPGLSRSGATISTGLLLGIKREEIARFSFLMVLIPIIGANVLDILSYNSSVNAEVSIPVLFAGFIAAFISGLIACKWMINLVKKGKLIYFAIYCLIIGIIAIIFA
jgi:undecaprenyl-diphosphatase